MTHKILTRALEGGIDADELRRASPDTRTVPASLSSDAPITHFGELEILSHAPGAIDLARAEGGLPLLIGHDASGIPIGRIDKLHVADGRLRGMLTFGSGARADEALVAVRDGVLRSTSVRYRPLAAEPILQDGRKVGMTITRWQLLEASLVAVPADHSVGVGRSLSTEQTMGKTIAAESGAQTSTEAERLAVIEQTARILNLDGAARRALVAAAADKTIDELRTMALNEAARVCDAASGRSGAITDWYPSTTEEVSSGIVARDRRQLMAEALCVRFAGGELSEAARPFARMRIRDMARECLERAGARTTYMGDGELIRAAMHTTSDFPIILGDSIGRAVAQAYAAAPLPLKACARERMAADFRALTTVRLGEAPSLETVNEAGEFKYGTVDEGAEAFRLITYGRIFNISRQALVNDDLSVFDSIRTAFVQAALEREAAVLVGLLTSNPTMQTDGIALFHASHGNLAGTPAALSDSALSDARKALRLMKGLDGETPIDAAPRWLVVPAALETPAEKLLSTIQATKTSDANPFSALQLVVEPRLDAKSTTAWYVASSRVDCLQYAYLEGDRGPVIEIQQGFEVDGVKVRCRLDFGAGFADYRGWYKNAGA